METIFSKIIAKEIPADIVYEDDQILAFLDIKPVNPGHTLVIPKEPVIDGVEASEETMAAVMRVAQKVARAQKKTLGCTGVNYIMNNGEDAGQEVFHAHMHVIPRYKDDNTFSSPNHNDYKEGEVTEIADKLRDTI
tara:strand:- start:237 stop:644 length:408 start_codon:yes stop_codon:yes gene_type:complete